MVYQWLKIDQWRLPRVCRLCGGEGQPERDLCAGCEADLPWLGHACAACALPLAGGASHCGRCLRRPWPFDAVLAPLRYASPVDLLVHEFKFRQKLASGRLLAELMLNAAADRPRPELLLPVPLHPARLRSRGYNQAYELARYLGRRLNIRCDPRLLVKTRETAAQHDLPAQERRANIRHTFALAGPLRVRHAAVVDDVLTTGQTAAEIARTLRRAGAEQVEVWVAARAG